jgi:HAD superfamily hydrolase (TIGR01509 family)
VIKAIIFDCFGVLTADKWHEFRLQLPKELQGRASKLNQQYCQGQISKQAFLETVAGLTDYPLSSIRQLVDNDMDKNSQLLEYIKSLKPHYKIGLLSNVANNWIRDYFLTQEEQKLFDNYILSFEVGITKPNPHIFRLASERLDVSPDQCVFVDDIERYCEAARGIGMQAVCYDNFEQFKSELVPLLSQQ